MAIEESGWRPELSYEFELFVGDNDYSTDLQRIVIRTGVNVPYQHVILDIFMDPRDILVEDLFGQEPIKLIINLIGKTADRYDEPIKYSFDLMYIDTEGDFTPAQQNFEGDQWERGIVSLKTVPIEAYKTMTTMVNEIYFNKTPYDIISDMVSGLTSLKYDPQGRSSLSIDQLLIPPTTVYNSIKYIDKTYGIFEGPLGVYCTFENKLKIQNLSKKVRDAQKYTLYLLATNRDQTDVLESDDPTIFYTKNPLGVSYEGNSVFTVKAPTEKVIVKPRDELSYTIDVDLETFIKTYGIIEPNNPKVYYNKRAIQTSKRVLIQKDQTGYDKDETFIKSRIGNDIREMAVVTAQIEGNLPVLEMMEVGEHVKIISNVDEQLKLGGAYVLKASEIQFIKAQQWESLANVHMIRSNIAAQ